MRPPGFSIASEREAICGFLDLQRAALVRKVQGLNDVDARRAPTVSSLTMLGLLKHSALWEHRWVQVVFAGHRSADGWPDRRSTPGPDGFSLDDGDTVDTCINSYQHEVDVSREIAASTDLATPCARPEFATRNLRWVLLHLIEETARHAGHADIIRETLDGSRGI
jgi:Protein of unknown function (DUF664)